MDKPKVLFAVGSLHGGGAERVVSVWANQMAERGYNVAILVFARSKDEYTLSDKVSVYSCADSLEDYLALSYFKRFVFYRQVLKTYSPNYIIPFLRTTRMWMFFSSIGLSIKRIETIRINPWVEEKSINFVSRIINRLIFRLAYKIIIQAREQRDWLAKNDRMKAVLIPNPLQEKYMQLDNVSRKEVVTNFISVGRLHPQKNYPMLIQGFAKVAQRFPHLKLYIWGSGPTRYVEELENQIQACLMSDNIFLMGRSYEIENEYLRSDVFVMTSDYEGSPNALIEAMASGLVCVSTDCKTGPKELIDSEINGFLIPVGSEAGLSEVLQNILTMSVDDRLKIGRQAREKVLNVHSVANSVCALCNLFND